MQIHVITTQKDILDIITPIFKRHNLKVIYHPILLSRTESFSSFLSKARKIYSHNSNILVLPSTRGRIARLGIYLSEKNDFSWLEASGVRSIEKVFSEYVVKFHSSPIQKLSCRDDVSVLVSFTTETGAVAFEGNPKIWIASSPFLQKLKAPMYSRLVNFVLNERGMFPKVWQLEAQKNYWNSTYNGGLPIIKKRDLIHESTFMLHDMWHFVFIDPIITGEENESDVMAYVLESKALFTVYQDKSIE